MSTEFDRVDAERTKQDLQTARRDLVRAMEAHQLELARREAEVLSLRNSVESLQATVDNLTSQRNKESRLRTDQSKQVESLRAENLKLRRELSSALDSKASHLRVPQVSFEQYRELVQVLEVYQGLLANGAVMEGAVVSAGSGRDGTSLASPSAVPSLAVASAKAWIDRMEAAPFVARSANDVTTATSSGGDHAHRIPMSSPQPAPDVSPRNATAASPGRASPGRAQPSASTRESIVEGGKLVRIATDVHPRTSENPSDSAIKQWSILNATSDTQFIVEYTFGPLSQVEPMGDTTIDGRTFRLNLYPHESKPFVIGTINGYKMSVRYGPPDEGYIAPSSLTDTDVMPLIDRVRTVWRRSPPGTDVSEIAALCHSDGTPFLDVEFPPVSSAMVRSFELLQEESPPVVHWLPPTKWLPKGVQPELCRSAVHPTALVSSAEASDAWLVSGMAALAEDPNLIGQIFSPTLTSDEQVGLYSVWINKHGLWNIVSVDHYLPCKETSSSSLASNGHRGQQAFSLFGARARVDCDLWPAILEKVFAKCHGSYYSLKHGDVLEALQDLTGFPVERFDWSRDRDTGIFPAIHKALSGSSGSTSHAQQQRPGSNATSSNNTNIVMLATATSAASDAKLIRSIGFEAQGAFRVLAAVAAEQFRMVLIRVALRNDAAKWSGNWSEGHAMWGRYPNVLAACRSASAGIEDIGSCVWMEWRDVARYFGGCGVCYVRPEWLDLRIGNRFVKNKPAFMLEVTVGGQGSRVFVGLHQKDRRGLPSTDPDHLYGAFMLTVVASSPNGTWDVLAQSHGGTFWRGRDAFLDVLLEPRTTPYYIVPRRYSAEGTKDTVLSMHVEDRSAVHVSLLDVSDDVLSSLRYTPLHKFDPTHASELKRLECQVDREPSKQLSW